MDAGKAFDKTEHPFMIKTLSRLGIKGIYLNIIKVIHSKPTADIIWGKVGRFSFKMRKKTKMPTLTTPIQHSTGSPSQSS